MITEMARVQTEAQHRSFEENGFDQYTFHSLGTACPHCLAINGKHFGMEDMQPGVNAPPMHPNCVLPDTKIIAPDIEAIMRSEYSGNVVELGLSNGTRLSVTPNHIVLTARGWVRAKNLIKGDKVVNYCGRVKSMVETNPTNNNGVPTIEKLLLRSANLARCLPLACQFPPKTSRAMLFPIAKSILYLSTAS